MKILRSLKQLFCAHKSPITISYASGYYKNTKSGAYKPKLRYRIYEYEECARCGKRLHKRKSVRSGLTEIEAKKYLKYLRNDD